MCGVIGLIFERQRDDLGRVASELLEQLEYRGYDSTGACVLNDRGDVVLKKGVGAPSVMVHELGITKMSGHIFCGQVRWATFGAVDERNSQPHVVECREHIVGAHNGNVTNCDELEKWLSSEGHRIASDNDGEMVVHTVEHFFDLELENLPKDRRLDHDSRRQAMRTAVCRAAARLRGSYAAVVVDPVTRCLWAVKQGSSLYFGTGEDDEGGAFTIASSDLSAVLRLTRILVPMSEGEFVEFRDGSYQVYSVTDDEQPAGTPRERAPVRSRLQAKDTALLPDFESFMDQEISAQEETCRAVISLFQGGSAMARRLAPMIEALPATERVEIDTRLEDLRRQYSDDALRSAFHALADGPAFRRLLEAIPSQIMEEILDTPPERTADLLRSSEAGFLADLLPMARSRTDVACVRILDVETEVGEAQEFNAAVAEFVKACTTSLTAGGRLFVVCCGTSYHAAKAAALFFDTTAHTEVIPVLPGEFRGQYAHSLKDGDLFIAVSQSGETKDLIDVMNDVTASPFEIQRVAIVNNVNSTLALEKSDLVIPLRCGPEIAVPATKSFINQLVVFYCLAIRVAEKRVGTLPIPEDQKRNLQQELDERIEKLPRLPRLIRETFDFTEIDIEQAAKMLYLAPSMQILATRLTAVAKEGALKVREVVLNHTEGFEGSEFKHGPNTILGFNTIFGPEEIDALLKRVGRDLDALISQAVERGMSGEALGRLVQATTDTVFSPTDSLLSLQDEERALFHECIDREDLLDELYSDYPLIYVTGPDERDVHLTISQINTHKIRGAITVVIAEDHPELRQAASKAPAGNTSYRSVYIPLPRTNDTLMTMFSSTIVLQRLALKMSELKMQYLDQRGIKDHGVHPDVPKNVSKSITVD